MNAQRVILRALQDIPLTSMSSLDQVSTGPPKVIEIRLAAHSLYDAKVAKNAQMLV